MHPIGSASVNLLNREFVFFTGNCRVRVDDGETFELVSPMSFKYSSVLTKLGYGVWAVGGAVTVANSPSVKISEGYVRADNARAFVSLPLTIAEGAGIAAKYRPGATDEASQYGLLVTDAAKFTVAGGTVAFMAEMPAGTVVKASMRVPLLTVPPAVAAVLDTKKLILVQNVDGRQGVVEKDEVTIGDVQYVRYSGKFRRGFLLSVR